VKCWGRNEFAMNDGYGMLGQGDESDRGDGPNEMGSNLPPVDFGVGRSAVAVSAAYQHTCALLDDASVKCWGSNWNDELGQGDTTDRGGAPNGECMGDSLPAVDLGADRTAVAISTGSAISCALLDDATVKCWGGNWMGQLGRGDTSARGPGGEYLGDNCPVVDFGGNRTRTAVAISAGNSHTCALLDDASVKCWGWNGDGRLGQGDTENRGDDPNEMGDNLHAVLLGAGRTAVAVSAGNSHTCALLDDATVKCWGHNGQGQLGQGDTENRGDEPNAEMGDNLPVVLLGAGRTAVAVSAGSLHTCALLDDATVKCWGGNWMGQLGQGDTTNRGDGPNEMADTLPAVLLGAGRTAVAVNAGEGTTCALLVSRSPCGLMCRDPRGC
ncbi:regulator of chromosome condensation 1/beta-lactamase-inhibitor protein II, partial [Baffinella frigidus]